MWLLVPVVWIIMARSFSKRRGRGYKYTNHYIIGALRSILVILLGLSLSDPRILSGLDRVNLFFCLDVSDSIAADKKTAALKFMQEAGTLLKKGDRAGLVIFGKHPSVEISLGENFAPREVRSEVNKNFTNIHEALRLAIGRLPQPGNNRIILFSDGNENLQSAMEMAHLAGSLGIEIYPVPLASWFDKGEVFIRKLATPPTVALETPFEISTVVMS